MTADRLAKLLGLAADWAAPLPSGPLELQGVEAAEEEGGGRCRGGMRLLARRAFRRSHPLGVLVALRDIAPGEELLRDYGAEWWRALAGVWVVAEDVGLAGDRLFRGAGGAPGGAGEGA